ncbi:MAG: hypothetical protein U1E39_02735 [Planctomycetota bacterium]
MSRPRKLGLLGGVAFVGGLVALLTVAASRAGHVAPPTRVPLRPDVGAVATTSFVAAETGRHEVRVVVPRSLKAADLAAAVGPRDAAAPAPAPPPFGADAKVTRDGALVATGRLDDDRAPVWDADAVSLLAVAFDATPGATYAVEVRVSRAALSLAAAPPAVTVGPALALRKEVAFGGAVTRGSLLFGATLLLAAGTIALVAAWATRAR